MTSITKISNGRPDPILLPTSGSEQVSFGWEIISDGGLEFGGWTVDDVCVYGVVVPESQDDSEADSSDGQDFGKDDSFVGCGCSAAPSPETAWLFGFGLLDLSFNAEGLRTMIGFPMLAISLAAEPPLHLC